MSRVEGRGFHVEGEGTMSRVEGNIFFSNFFFLEKVIIDAINVIKTNKKNLKSKWREGKTIKMRRWRRKNNGNEEEEVEKEEEGKQ